MIWKQLLLWWIRPSLPDHVSPLLLPREALVIFLRSGGVLKRERGEGGGSLSAFKAQGDTLNNGAPVPTVDAHTTHACVLALMYGPENSKCVW